MTRPAGALLRVVSTDPTPPFEQVRKQLAELIGGGALPTGARLPPVRQLAADLGLATGTVARAYRELEIAGLVQTRRGGGTRVAPRGPAEGTGQSPGWSEVLAHLAEEFVRAARGLGADDSELSAAVSAALGAHDPTLGCRPAERQPNVPVRVDQGKGPVPP